MRAEFQKVYSLIFTELSIMKTKMSLTEKYTKITSSRKERLKFVAWWISKQYIKEKLLHKPEYKATLKLGNVLFSQEEEKKSLNI